VAVTLLVRMRARPGAEDRLAALLGDLARASREEPGCQAFVAHRSPDDGSAFMLYERWEGEAAMESHRATDHFTRAIDEFPLLLVAERTRELWDPLD
jgi:quinol monooxygenase YgiN